MMFNNGKTTAIVVLVVILFVSVLSVALSAGGEIEFRFEEEALTVHSKLWKDRTVAYGDVESAALREDLNIGKRTNGFGSAKLSMGDFRNDEYGPYLLYAYAGCGKFVEMKLKDGSVFVIGGENAAESEKLYESLLKHLP